MKKLIALSLSLFCISLISAQPDLELSIKISITDNSFDVGAIPQFTNRTYEIIVQNKGNANADNVLVQLDYSDLGDLRDFSYTSHQTSDGSYEIVGKFWTIGSIPAGGKAQLNLVLFNMKNGFQRIYGQIIQATPDDLDSTPGNNTTGIPAEDDEAVFGFNAAGASLPDYFSDNLEVSATTVEVGNSIALSFDFFNPGSPQTEASPNNSDTRIILSPTTSFDPDNYISLSVASINQQFLGTAFLSGEIPLGLGIPDGNYFIMVVSDIREQVAESNENNNVLLGPQLRVINTVLPDVEGRLNQFRLPQSFTAGGSIVAQQLLVQNNTAVLPSIPFVSSVYLSMDNQFSSDDVLILEQEIPFVNQSYFISFLTIPFNTTPGNYHWIVFTDSNDDIPETDESNNIWSWPIQVNPNNGVTPKPDLNLTVSLAQEVYDLCCPNALGNRSDFRVENIGNSGALNARSGIYLSTDQFLDQGDILIKEESNSTLNPGQSNSFNTRYQLDPATSPGNYFLLFVTDLSFSIEELNESNNVVASPLEVIDNELPELSILGATGENVAEQGGFLPVTVQIQNTGQRPSAPTDLTLWRVPEFPRDGGEAISQVDIPSIAPNSVIDVQANFPIKANQRIRDDYPTNLFVDFSRSVAEIDENNNLFGWPLSVVSATGDNRPDLVFDPDFRIFFNPHYLEEPSPQFQPLILNQGQSSATGGFTTHVYLSTDQQLDGSDILVGEDINGFTINKDEDLRLFVDLDIASGTTPGDYFLITQIDVNDEINELDENNNQFVIPFKIQNTPQADLVIDDVSAPANVGLDQPFDVDITFSNLGEAFDRDFRIGLYLTDINSTVITNSISFVSIAYEDPVASGQQVTVRLNISGNQFIAPGQYFLVPFVDLNEQVEETNENNNAAIRPITLGTATPDFFIEFVDCPNNFPNPGQDLVYDISAINFGTAPSPATTIYLYHAGPNPPFAKVLYGTADVPVLAPGAGQQVSISVPPSLYLPTDDNIGFGEKWLFTGQSYISLSADGSTVDFSEDTPLVNLNPGCLKYTTDLQMDLSAVTPVIEPDLSVTFEMTISNNGPEDAYNITSSIADGVAPSGFPIPEVNSQVSTGQVYRQFFASGGSTPFNFVWYIPFLASGESATASVSINPGALGWPSIGARIARGLESVHLLDPNLGNNLDALTIPFDSGDDELDLELSATVDRSNPPAFEFFTPRFSLENKGTVEATDVQVRISYPSGGIVPQGGDEFSASQGDLLFNIWWLGNLAPNAVATLDLNFFNLDENAKYVYAEVISQNPADVDSAPANGTEPLVNEDDEAVVNINVGSSGKPTVILSTATLTVGGPFRVDVEFSENVTDFMLSEIQVINGGKSNPVQLDGARYHFRVTPIAPGQVSIVIPADAVFNEDGLGNVGSEPLLVNFVQDPPAEGVDLELNALLSDESPAQWSFFSATFVLTNNGTEGANGVKIRIPTPEGIVLKGGAEYFASQGNFMPYSNQLWDLGSLSAGASATLELNYFNLSNERVTIFGQVTEQSEMDVDSTPDNNDSNVPNEDDEAAVSINVMGAAARSSFNTASVIHQIRDLKILNTYPTLTDQELTVVINSKKENLLIMKIYDSSAKELSQKKLGIIEGANEIRIDASSLSSGMYHVMFFPPSGRPVMTRFVKQKL